jgi:hypothetical protein
MLLYLTNFPGTWTKQLVNRDKRLIKRKHHTHRVVFKPAKRIFRYLDEH